MVSDYKYGHESFNLHIKQKPLSILTIKNEVAIKLSSGAYGIKACNIILVHYTAREVSASSHEIDRHIAVYQST
jgi:hypothetical protein